ncbi:hypothetical protein GDO78_020416 [Eleutherodactylus coqui]|uniref:Uncharacterized protein n=1 Tax=Eleutherodactylus coqui TaxID=57060 RepID=A0A8J6EQQ3_ELECQ|nr:hypothetical protein GDO78_020416 [Eleutherodactylus coqui]
MGSVIANTAGLFYLQQLLIIPSSAICPIMEIWDVFHTFQGIFFILSGQRVDDDYRIHLCPWGLPYVPSVSYVYSHFISLQYECVLQCIRQLKHIC